MEYLIPQFDQWWLCLSSKIGPTIPQLFLPQNSSPLKEKIQQLQQTMAQSLLPPFQTPPKQNSETAPKQAGANLYCCQRRPFAFGLLVAGLCSWSYSESALATKRPPPPPPKEKKDPNVGGVQAKVLASKKRKEALKEEVARLRERGKPVS